MRTRILIACVAVVIALSGCGPSSRQPEMSPQEVVTRFYRWYVGYPGNPLVDKEYRQSPYLADSFVEQIDEALASMDRGGADPILLAQDIPERFSVDEAEIADDWAAVIVSLYWSGNPTPSRRQVDLALTEGEWRITGVSVVEP